LVNERPLLILGTRPISTEIADIATDAGFEVTGYVENMDRDRGTELDGLPIHWIDDIAELVHDHQVVAGLTTTQRRRFTSQAEQMGFGFATVIHPSAHVSRRSTVGRGSVVGPLAVIGSHTAIEEHVYISRGALVGHHTTIRDHSTLLPGVNLAGSCSVGPSAWIGMGAVVIDGLTIGRGCMIAAGSVVVKDVADHVMVMGVPARVVREGIEAR
jgi:sugar O-acyltransferase (sialic acid O-acetyltransferase NeuD family)